MDKEEEEEEEEDDLNVKMDFEDKRGSTRSFFKTEDEKSRKFNLKGEIMHQTLTTITETTDM